MTPVQSDSYERTAKLRLTFLSERMSPKAALGLRSERDFLENLRLRYSEIDTTAKGAAGHEQARRFERLMREWSPIGYWFRDVKSIAGKPTRETREALEYEFDTGTKMATWRIIRYTHPEVEPALGSVVAVEYSGPIPVPSGETGQRGRVAPATARPTEKLWAAYVRAERPEELAKARTALAADLKRRYPGIDARLRGVEHWPMAINSGLAFKECNPMLWPVADLKAVQGEPTSVKKDTLEYLFHPADVSWSWTFKTQKGVIVGMEYRGGQ